MFELPSDDEKQSEELLTRRANSACLSEAELDDFLHDRLSGTTRESVEEHLLYCGSCLDRVEAEETFTAAFRTAARRIEAERLKTAFSGPKPNWAARVWDWLRRPYGVGLGLAMVGAVAAVSLLVIPAMRQRPVMEVTLMAERGLSSSFSPSAGSGRLLRLNLDATGLPGAALRVELAGPGNQIIARSTASVAEGQLRWDLGRSLDTGSYWVRLYQQNPDTLLREYALTVK